jgi:hypothetical protein
LQASPALWRHAYHDAGGAYAADVVLARRVEGAGGIAEDRQLLAESFGQLALPGVRRGDVLVRLGRYSVKSVEDLITALSKLDPNTTTAAVLRDGKQVEIEVTTAAGRTVRRRVDVSSLRHHTWMTSPSTKPVDYRGAGAQRGSTDERFTPT